MVIMRIDKKIYLIVQFYIDSRLLFLDYFNSFRMEKQTEINLNKRSKK